MPVTHGSPVSYRARWVFPIDQPPIANGVVTVAGDQIVSVGTKGTDSTWIDLGNVALLPALINAHTHLEFSLFDRPIGVAGESFAAWLKQVVSWRRQQPAILGQEALALETGLRESEANGVALLGEICTPMFAEMWKNREQDEPHVLFLELLSLNPDRVEPLCALAEEFTRESETPSLTRRANGGTARGLSPHAPYTVHPEILSRAVQLSAERRFPLTMHVAESREELELLASQSGSLVELLKSMAAWYPKSLPMGLRPLSYLKTLSKAHRTLVAHGNFLQADEIAFLAQQRERMSVVYCPRTQAYFDHGPYPLQEMLQAGVRVAVGTDSRASNPDLSIWNELKFIHSQHPQIDPGQILNMGTIAGAEALGLSQWSGSITPRKLARLAVVEFANADDSGLESLLQSATTCRRLS